MGAYLEGWAVTVVSEEVWAAVLAAGAVVATGVVTVDTEDTEAPVGMVDTMDIVDMEDTDLAGRA